MPGTKKDAKEFSVLDTVKDAIKHVLPIPGRMNLEKVGKIEIITPAAVASGILDATVIKPLKEFNPEGYKNRETFEEAFNNHWFNIIFRPRNLMSGKKPITIGGLVNNLFRDMAGFTEELAPEGQKVVNIIGNIPFFAKAILTFTWSLTKKILGIPLDIAKLFVVALPEALYELSYHGMISAVDKIKEIRKNMEERNKPSKRTGGESTDDFIDGLKIAGFGFLAGAAAVAFGLTRFWHFIGNAVLAPRENFRDFWNQVDKKGKPSVAGKILAVVSLITTIAAYTAAAFFLAPLAMEGLSSLAIATAGTPFGGFVGSIVAGISKLASAMSVVTSPIGAALTSALEFLAGYLPFLAPAALAAGNMIPTTLGLLTLAGAAIAVVGTGESMAQGALSDKYHSYALEKSIKKNTAAGSTLGLLNTMPKKPEPGETTSLLHETETGPTPGSKPASVLGAKPISGAGKSSLYTPTPPPSEDEKEEGRLSRSSSFSGRGKGSK